MLTKARIVSALALFAVAASPVASWAGQPPLSTFVVMGEEGRPVVRAIMAGGPACPVVKVDGRRRPMRLRAGPAQLPLRPTQSAPENSKPSDFPVSVCEGILPRGARHASVEGERLALPPVRVSRIVVIGDTGCRLKASEKAFQDCNDPAAYPFAAIAARAAAWKPDLVVHVGDYLYRENPCPADHAGCQGSPWGYGWDAWRADFFDPARPLLAAAPWAAARGNHENCSRAGQGWWRLLDPHALVTGRDCVDPADDLKGDYSPAYAIPLGGAAQVILFDLAAAGGRPLAETDPAAPQFRQTYADLKRLSGRAKFNFAVNHKPVLGVSAAEVNDVVGLQPGNRAIQSVFARSGARIMPPGVDVLLAGHTHLWEQVDFASDHPSQFITGFSGTQEDVLPLPAALPSGLEPAPGAKVAHFSSWTGGFGFMTLERTGSEAWSATVWNLQGEPVNRCRIHGRRSECDRAQITP